jgi:hypothetical protein
LSTAGTTDWGSTDDGAVVPVLDATSCNLATVSAVICGSTTGCVVAVMLDVTGAESLSVAAGGIALVGFSVGTSDKAPCERVRAIERAMDLSVRQLYNEGICKLYEVTNGATEQRGCVQI